MNFMTFLMKYTPLTFEPSAINLIHPSSIQNGKKCMSLFDFIITRIIIKVRRVTLSGMYFNFSIQGSNQTHYSLKMVQMAQIHTGDLLQHPLLDMLNWAGLGCCLPGNWLSTSSGACKGPRRWCERHSGEMDRL